MRDLLVGVAMLGILVGVGCGVAQATAKSDLAQYRAESPNYSLEYVEETVPAGKTEVQGEAQAQETATPAPTTELPATNPPFALIGAVALAIGIAVVAYIVLR